MTMGEGQASTVISGLAEGDDAAVVEVPSGGKVILTLDFFPPMVDDPYLFGQIAAANALSDVFAMGANPVAALNICCFPPCLDPDVLSEIIRGGAEKVLEAGALLVGGHTIEDDVPKYGLSVMGFAQTESIWEKSGASAGDFVVLTKPLGTGLVVTAQKAGAGDEESFQEACRWMATLNRRARDLMAPFEPGACTDVTGFGLTGHALEICLKSNLSMKLDFSSLPFIGKALQLSEEWLFPAGTHSNTSAYKESTRFSETLGDHLRGLCNTPETSGGLLACVGPDKIQDLKESFARAEAPLWVIGRTLEPESRPELQIL